MIGTFTPDEFGFPFVDLPLSAVGSPDAVVKFLVGTLVESGRLSVESADRAMCQVFHRESLGSTGIGRGIALPHSKSDVVDQVIGVIGRSTVPINWPGAVDSQPVQTVCLLINPASDPAASMRALEAMSRRLRGESA